MQFPRAYRSLPRPSSQPKPSYSSNSLNNQAVFTVEAILLVSLNIKTPSKSLVNIFSTPLADFTVEVHALLMFKLVSEFHMMSEIKTTFFIMGLQITAFNF